jgi:hypothetical protein
MRLFRRSDAVRTTAELLAIAATARGYRETGRRNVEQSLELLVDLPGTGPVRMNLVARVPWDRTPLVGDRIPLDVDVAQRKVVRVTWDEMPSLTARSRASAEAARNGDTAGAARALGFELKDPEAAFGE